MPDAFRSDGLAEPKCPARLTLVIAHLGAGGAQKVLISLANHWATLGFTVTLVSVASIQSPLYFKPHDSVTLIDLSLAGEAKGLWQALTNNLRRLARLRHVIHESRPDAVLSFLSVTNINTLIATRGLGVQVIVSERGDPDRATLSPFRRWLRRVVYPWAFRLVTQTEHARDRFRGTVQRRALVIPNPVDTPTIHRPANGCTVVGVGHLVDVKGFDILLEAFARVAGRHGEWRLVIWGE
ncbi:MAG: glycosyltransferase, partial [Pseudomonadota bacterium]